MYLSRIDLFDVNMKHDDVEKAVLRLVLPSKKSQSEVEGAADTVVSKIALGLKKAGVLANVIVGGSLAKGTNLAIKTDVDIFVRFDFGKYEGKSGELSDILESVLDSVFAKKVGISRVHGSRDYFQLSFKGFDFEIVPILAISESSMAVNITDVTPLHVTYVNSNANKSLKKQICLSKQFAKANGCYGAESYIRGFSGYVLEILTIYYGSFQSLLSASLKWKLSVESDAKKTVVDPSSFHKGKNVAFEIDVSKLKSPIVVVDPVDKWRNAAAALNLDKVKKFRTCARKYLKEADSLFFDKRIINLSSLRKIALAKKLNLIYIEIEPLTGKRDVVGCQILKIYDFVAKELSLFSVDANYSAWEWPGSGKARLYYLLKKKKLPLEYVISGPPVTMSAACDSFRKAHSNVFEDSGKMYATKKRLVLDLDQFVAKLVLRKYVSERSANIEVIES